MKRAKRHKIKHEIPETSTARLKDSEEHDLAYYIHDRVELMHQVFSVIKLKEFKALAPECVRHISIDDLQELCTEELLGISSKRLCAILDGAEPPSDTESSSSSPELETISLDSISSDDEILSQPSSKGRKHKHKKHGKSKSKHRRRSSKHDEADDNEAEDQSKASRAGLTVLELLELQARARAIRAQLQRDQRRSPENTETAKPTQSDDEVEIKEEPAEVVEISSDEEKPNVKDLEDKLNNKEQEQPSGKVTKRINDLIITVPQTKQSRKIKLNRPKTVPLEDTAKDTDKPKETREQIKKVQVPQDKEKDVKKKKQKKKQRKEKDSDHDEITLQLSDTEKMDLLEDLDRKNYDSVTSEDSESSSDTDDNTSDSSQDNLTSNDSSAPNTSAKDVANRSKPHELASNDSANKKSNEALKASDQNNPLSDMDFAEKTSNMEKQNEADLEKSLTNKDTDKSTNTTNVYSNTENNISSEEKHVDTSDLTNIALKDAELLDSCISRESSTEENQTGKQISKEATEDKSQTLQENVNSLLAKSTDVNGDTECKDTAETIETLQNPKNDKNEDTPAIVNTKNDKIDSSFKDMDAHLSKYEKNIIEEVSDTNSNLNDAKNIQDNAGNKENDIEEGEIDSNKDVSDGEISEHQPEIVCISDDEVKKKKKKKKDKKSKKEKLGSKSEKSDFREGADQNFFEESVEKNEIKKEPQIIVIDDEIYELSDDSSCFEVEGVNVLSEEPTTEEIVALSAKIDDTIEKEDSDEQKEIEMSWKDRYLGSKKVKRVLTTSNILNALRKKNKELKAKLEEKKLKDLEEQKLQESEKETEEPRENVEEGSIDHYNTLEGSTKYVEPVVEKPQETPNISKEMEKDAKQLLKMYKKLLKYNDMTRKKDPNKKSKKKSKKKKDKDSKDK